MQRLRKKRKPKILLLLVLAIPLFLCATVRCQDGQKTRGFYPGASYAVSDIDVINTKNGNLMLSVPLTSLAPGRTGLSSGVGLFYDSKIYDTFSHPEGRYPEGPNTTELVQSQEGGWRYGFQYEYKLCNRFDTYQPMTPSLSEQSYVWKLKLKFPDGSEHVFRPLSYTDALNDDYFQIRPDGWVTTPGQADSPAVFGNMTYYTADGTYLRLDMIHDADSDPNNNSWTLYLSEGGRVTGGGSANQRIYDRNGNFIEIQNITYNGNPATKILDQMGRYLIIEYGPTGQDYVRAWRMENGQLTELTWTVKWRGVGGGKAYYANPNDIPIGTVFFTPGLSGVDEIVLPAQSGGLLYKFGYNSDSTPTGWGEVSSVTSPSGAKTSYQYEWGAGDVDFDYVLKSHPTQKSLVYRPENDISGGVSNTPCNTQTETCITETTSFSYDFLANGVMAGVTTTPDGSVTRDYFEGSNYAPSESQPPFNPVFKSERPDGTMLETIWLINRPFGCNPNRLGVNPFVKTEFVSIKNSAGSYVKTKIKDYNYDKNGNVTRVAEYDWVNFAAVPRGSNGRPTGIPVGASMKRVTTSTYYSPTPDASNTSTDDSDSYHKASSPQLRNAIESREVSLDGSANALSRTEYFYDSTTTTGNLTQQKSWDSTKGAITRPLSGTNSISVSNQYDAFGNVTLATDARGFQTKTEYTAINGYLGLYPTRKIAAFGTSLARTTDRQYDFNSGAVTRETDVDNNVSIATTYDIFGRPILVKAAENNPEETRTATEYSDTARRIIERADMTTVGDGKLVSIKHYDQLGRIRLNRQLEDAATQSPTDETTGIKVQTRYKFSALNSFQMVSNPYRASFSYNASGEATMGWTRTKSDNGGRVIEMQTFGGNALPAPWGTNTTSTGTVSIAYDAEFTTVTDQAGKVRRSMADGLGQLSRVDEPDASNNLGPTSAPVQPTSYSYIALGSLTTVTQGSQTRTFVYSSLSRLTSATNPESGNVTYQYDNNGNLLVKTDARTDPNDPTKKVSAHFEYDALNRATRRWYNGSSSLTAVTHNSPTLPPFVGATDEVKFYYDSQALSGAPAGYDRGSAIGRLVAQIYSTGSSGDYYSYDVLGRQTVKFQQMGSKNYKLTANYTLSGAVSSLTYPSNHSITNAYDPAGRLTAFSGDLGDGLPRTYSTGIVYSPLGGLLKEQFGTNTPVYHKLHYNSRSQICDVRASVVNDEWGGELGALAFYYHTPVSHCDNGPNNNGNLVMSQTIVNSVYFEDRYTYDSLNRLASVSEYQNGTGFIGTQEYDYDRWGNRTIKTTTSAIFNKKQFSVNTANNRLGVPSGQPGVMEYDAAGNLTNDTYTGAGNRTYDAENKLTSAWGGNNQAQTYKYDGAGQRIKRTVNGDETWQVYGFGGELIAEYPVDGDTSNPLKEYGYRNGELLVTSALDTVWSDDAVPTGAAVAGDGDSWNWVVSNPSSFSGSAAHQSNILAGLHQHYFYGATATLSVIAGDKLLAYVYLDPSNMPSEIMLQWTDGSWEHRAYWGANNLPWGIDGTSSRRYMGPLPAAGSWVRLEVPASLVGLEGHTLHGMAFSMWGGRATWDRTGKTSSVTTSAMETVWSQDAVPAGAAVAGDGDSWNWVSSNPGPFSGSAAHQSNIASGLHQHYFYGATATLSLNAGDKLVAYVYLDPSNMPSQIMLQWAEGGSWEHRAYWGANNLPWGVDGTNSRRNMGPLPAAGSWVRLEVPASLVGLEGQTLHGMAFSMWGGRATWDRAGKTAAAGVGFLLQWLVSDPLGTPRMIIDQTGTLANVKRHDYLPFGEELFAGIGGRTVPLGYAAGDGVRQQFTSKERDIETSLDYFLARYYSSTQGRFTSPDEFKGGPDELFVRTGDSKKQALPYAEITQPQSLNKYAYVYNNPCRYIDPDGHCGTPSGLKPGQVGICVASFIASTLVKSGGLPSPGRGDDRGPNGQGGTSRVEVRVAVDVSKGTVAKTDETMARSGIVIKDVGPKGSGGSEVTSANKDDKGNVYFQIHQVGTSNTPVGSIGSIENHLNMVVTADGKVGITPSSTAKDYPSLEVYKYTVDDKGNVTTTLIKHKQESNNVWDLMNKEKPIKADPQ